MKLFGKLALLGGLAISAGLLAPLSQAHASTRVSISVGYGPPPARYERVPALRAGFIWAPGYWHWNSVRYVWIPGAWQRNRVGYVYNRPRWVHSHGRWEFRRAAWHRAEYRAYRHGRRVQHRRDVRHRR